jgi:hypothetical protein
MRSLIELDQLCGVFAVPPTLSLQPPIDDAGDWDIVPTTSGVKPPPHR